MILKFTISDYLEIYFWRIASLCFGLLSLLVVIPFISSNKELFGVYSICVSFIIYFTYADLGFLAAGQKYAAEALARFDEAEVIGNIGFVGFILILFVVPVSGVLFVLANNPSIMITGLDESTGEIASKLFLILAVFGPLQIFLQRLSQSILTIRLKDSIAIKTEVFFNFLKVLSIGYFFAREDYMIVEYSLFISTMSVLSPIVALFVIHKRKIMDIRKLALEIRPSWKYFGIQKDLALSSFFISISWIIFYEMDLIIVGRLSGADAVAIYAIAFSLVNLVKNLFTMVFAPFSHRLNHLMAVRDFEKVSVLTQDLVSYSLYILAAILVASYIGAYQVIVAWVGPEYSTSTPIFLVLVGGFSLSFLNQPAKFYFTAAVKTRILNRIAIFSPFVFVGLIFLTYDYYGPISVAFSKCAVFVCVFWFSYWGLKQDIDIGKLIGRILPRTLILSILIGILGRKTLAEYGNSVQKSSLELGAWLFLLSLLGCFTFLTLVLLDKNTRMTISAYLRGVMRR